MSLDGFNSGRATITGIGAGQGTLRLPATATAISIGGDFGQPDQVIAKNKTTNILEWDFVSDLSIPDHSIAGVKLKTDITFSTTGNIGLNNLTIGEGTGGSEHPTISNAQYDGTDATDRIYQDPTEIKERFTVSNTDGSATYLTASSGLGTGGNPIVSLSDAPLRIDYTTGNYSAQIGTATASGVLQGVNTTYRLSLKNTDFTDTSNLFGDHEFGDCAFGRIIVGGQDAGGTGRAPGQLILRDRTTNGNNLVMSSGNNSGARLQFSNGGSIEVSNTLNAQYTYAIRCNGGLEINGQGANGKLEFLDSQDKLKGHSSGTETTNLNLHDPSNQTPINYQAYQFVQLTDSSLPMGLIEIDASGPATVGGLTYFYPMTYDGDARITGGNGNFVKISINGKVGQRYFKICLKGYFGWEEENNTDLGVGQFYIQLSSVAGSGNFYPNSLFRVGITNRSMRGTDLALDGTHYCEYEYIYDYGGALTEDTSIDFFPEFANSFNSNPTGTTTTSDLYILGGIGGGVSAASPYWYSTTESLPYNPINTPSGEAVDLEGLDSIDMEGYPEMP